MHSKNASDDACIRIGVEPDSQKLRQLAKEIEMKKLRQACVWSVCFMVVEAVGGYCAGSLAIMTDAAHLLSDVASFGVALFAMSMGKLPPDSRMTWGYHRMEVMGAVVSVLIIWFITAGLMYAAVQRLIELSRLSKAADGATVEIVNGKVMFAVATCGLVVNLVLMKILGHHHGHHHGHQHVHSHGHERVHAHDHSEHTHSHDQHDHSHSHGHHDHDHSHGHKEHGHSNGNNDNGHSHDHDDHCHANSPRHAQEHHDHGESPATVHDHSARRSHNADEPSHKGHHEQIVDENPSVCSEDQLEGKSGHSHQGSLNIRAAYIHALGDFIQSLGVCIAGAIIWINPKLQVADPIVTILFCFMVLGTTHHLMKSSLLIMLEAAPETVDVPEILSELEALPSVSRVSRLAIWSLTTSHSAAIAHIEVDVFKNKVSCASLHHRALTDVQQCLVSHGIDVDQVTVQITTVKAH